jgi:transcriptional repressor NrdR
MRCPSCQHPKTSVIETREADETVRRRRDCARCHWRFTTYETARPQGLIVEDAQGGRLDFTRAWLQGALAAAGADLSGNALKKVAASVETELKTRGGAVVSTQELAAAAVRELAQIAPPRPGAPGSRLQAVAERGGSSGARGAARGAPVSQMLPTAEQVGAILNARFDGMRRTSAQLPLPMER